MEPLVYQRDLVEYCRKRLSQLEGYRPILRFFDCEEKIGQYGRGLEAIIQELTETRNDDLTKESNIRHALTSNLESNVLFGEDITDIQLGRKPQYPDNIFEIPTFKAERRRLEFEERERIRRERIEWEIKDLEQRNAAVEALQREQRKRQLMKDLGLNEKQLERLQQVG